MTIHFTQIGSYIDSFVGYYISTLFAYSSCCIIKPLQYVTGSEKSLHASVHNFDTIVCNFGLHVSRQMIQLHFSNTIRIYSYFSEVM